MRLVLACSLLAALGCGQKATQTQCMSMGGPSELVNDAKALKLDIYPDTVMCDAAGGVPSGALPLSSHTFRPGDDLKLDIPPGSRTLVLTTYGDEAGTIITGSGCVTTTLTPGGQVCINLTIIPAPDAGMGVDLSCPGGNCACTVSPDSCPAGQYCDGTMCQMGCKDAADCVGMGPSGDGGLPRTNCNLSTHQCAECNTNDQCPLGKLCSPSGVCTVGCDTGHGCPGQLTCCNSLCVDTTADAMNCGACNTPCTGGSCCGSACVDTGNDASNCGACGRACSRAGVASVACAGGLCTSTCTFGNGNCSRPGAPSPDDGCETPVNTIANCGACGVTCDPATGHGVPTCSLPDMGQAKCAWTCNGSFRDCNAAAPDSDGCETDVSSDKANCGACLNVCSSSGATATTCSGSQCTPTCDTSHLDCDTLSTNDGCEVTSSASGSCTACGTGCGALPANGMAWSCPAKSCVLACNASFTVCNGNTCKNLQNDSANCGACGHVCSMAGATSTSCVAGVCTPVCDATHFDCNADATNNDGCETTAGAAGSCTACGVGCGSLPQNGASWTCTAKSCVLACNVNFSVCNGNTCKNLQNDSANCGACGNVCDTSNNSGTACSGGNCTNSSCNLNQADCSQTNHNQDECETLAESTAHCGTCAACIAPPSGFITAAACPSPAPGVQATCAYTCDCGTGPQACVTHDTGAPNEHWFDCTPRDTWGSTEATRACQAHGGADCTHFFGCTGGGSNSILCDRAGGLGPCNCWDYTGTHAGHVYFGAPTDTTCFCPAGTDPAWH